MKQKIVRIGGSHARTFVVVMGIVAMFGDMTYEGARGLVGPYLGILGASAAAVGFAAGLGEFLGYGLRLATGWLADRTRAYWPLVILGYGLNLVAVPGLALVDSWQAAIGLLLLERIGKAIRSPARSTLVSYAANEVGAGWSFGLEEALDQLGAVTGPLITAAVIWSMRQHEPALQYRAAFAVLLLPVLANLGLVLLARRSYPTPESFESDRPAPTAQLGPLFRWYVVGASLMALGFADWALIAYHASKTQAIDIGLVPVLYAAVMAVDAIAALVFGRLFDRFGLGVLAGSALISAFFAPAAFLFPSAGLLVGAALWGVGMGAQDSIFKAAIAELVPKHGRSRAYGLFFAWFGLMWWLGSTVMGWLYDRSLPGLVAFSMVPQLAAVPILLYVGVALRRQDAPRSP